jgi:predicted Zn-dependent peptidase
MKIRQYSIPTSNGSMTLLHLPIPGATTLVRVIVEAGSLEERKDEHGLAHFLEHMAFKGTSRYNYEQLIQRMTRIGSPNAYTTDERTVYTLDSIPEFVDQAVDILSDVLFNSTYPEVEFEKEKQVIVQEWQTSEDNPMAYYFNHAGPIICNEHATIGDQQSILSHDLIKLREFKADNYFAKNIAFAIVGETTTSIEKLIGIIQTNYSQLKPFKALQRKPSLKSPKTDRQVLSLKHASKQAMLGIWWPWYTAAECFKKKNVSTLVISALGGGMHSLLFNELREKRGLCYACGMYNTSNDATASMLGYAMLDEKNLELAEKTIIETLTKVRNEGVDPELLETTRADFLINNAYALDSKASLSRSFIDRWFERSSYTDATVIRTMDDAKETTSLFTQQALKDHVDFLLQSGYHNIVMTKKEE